MGQPCEHNECLLIPEANSSCCSISVHKSFFTTSDILTSIFIIMEMLTINKAKVFVYLSPAETGQIDNFDSHISA